MVFPVFVLIVVAVKVIYFHVSYVSHAEYRYLGVISCELGHTGNGFVLIFMVIAYAVAFVIIDPVRPLCRDPEVLRFD